MKEAPTVDNLPERIKMYLNSRGLSDKVLARNHISWDGERIVIPIFDRSGVWLFNKYRRDPDSAIGPKYSYDSGAQSTLYGLDKLVGSTSVIICEGEFDALVLEANGFIAISSTGGAGTFKEEWADLLSPFEKFVCYDNDEAGEKGRVRLAKMLPGIKQVFIPFEVGKHGDITDFFVKLNKTAEDFKILMDVASPYVIKEEPKEPKRRRGNDGERSDRLKAAKEVPLSVVLKFNRQHFAKCPFHKDNTPSLHWYGENRWKCFGCGEQGDGIDLVMRMQNVSMKDAIDWLLKV